MPRFALILLGVLSLSTFAADPKLKPAHDAPDQLFRRAPMAQAARSVVVNLGTNLHFSFDTDLVRVHTIWRGGPLNLWGPPYSYSKSPFICDFDGTVLFSYPQVSPWWAQEKSLSTRFRAIETSKSGEVSFSSEILAEGKPIRVTETLRGVAENDVWRIRRMLSFPDGIPVGLRFLAFAEAGAKIERDGERLNVTGTNGPFVLSVAGAPAAKWSVGPEVVNYSSVTITEDATENGFSPVLHSGEESRAYLVVPEQSTPLTLEVLMEHGAPINSQHTIARSAAPTVFKRSQELRAPAGDESYRNEYFPLPPEAGLLVTGMDWLPNGDLAVCTWLGDVFFVQNVASDVREATYKRFASGLNEPLGLATRGNEIFVVQKGELTKISDSDGDGVADRFENVNSSWGYSGNYHSYSFGPLLAPGGDFFVFVTGQRGLYELPCQGWALRVGGNGEDVTPFCSGLRVPHGWGWYGPDHDLFATDNQGNWIGACRLNHLQAGKFYGFPSSKPASQKVHAADEVEPPVLWFPRSLAPSASGFDTIPDDRFGPFKGQLLIGDFQNSVVMRAYIEKVNHRWQGAVFPFAKGFLSGINRLKMGPDGKLYVGGGKRTWSTAAPKDYSLDRVAFTGKVPFEIKEVHATSRGFDLLFTKPLDKKAASDPSNYLIKQFTYRYHKEYGSPEFDHSGKVGATETPPKSVEMSENGLSVRLTIPDLKLGFVTSFQLAVTSAEDEDLRNDAFFYTLTSQPRNQ